MQILQMGPLRQALAILVASAVFVATSPRAVAFQQEANLTASEIDSIVSPIALYPDQLVAQILAASTYPDQVSAAGQWLNNNKSLQGEALMRAVDPQPWDPSVKALTQFPSVLDQMANNLAWTSALGDASFNQQADVAASIQRLRQQAKASGNLKSGEQIKVVQSDPQTIVIQPANPQVVYVPQYNPAVVYGVPYTPPGYSTAALVTTGIMSFGIGMAVGAAMSGGCCGWGWGPGWGYNWRGGNVMYQNNVYVSRSNNFYGANRANYRNNYYGGQRPANYNANNRYNGGNNRTGNLSGNTRNTNVSGNTVNINTGGNNNGNRNTGATTNLRNSNTGTASKRNPDAAGNIRNPNAGSQADALRGGNAGNVGATARQSDRGFGQQQAGGNRGAFGGQGAGGSAGADSSRGRQSMGAGGGNARANTQKQGSTARQNQGGGGRQRKQ